MNKVKDSLVGFAIGDAMGVPIEFESRNKLLKHPITSMIGFGSYDVPEGTWSDDTSMTLATFDSIIECNDIDYNNIADKFCDWFNYAKYTATDEVFDIGITTKNAIIRYWYDKSDATKCGGHSFNENGNGSLMRMLPIALFCYYKKLNDKRIYEIVKKVSSITHAHNISIMGCFIYVKFLGYILQGKNKLDSYNLIKKINYSTYFTKEIINEYERLLNGSINNLDIDEINSNGYIVYTLETVLWIILNTHSYEQSIIGAINLGGDTDTIGAITGSIAGILYGYDNIPKRWLKKLRKIELILEIVKKFDIVIN